MDYLIYIILPIAIPAIIAYFISRSVFIRLKKKENKNAKLFSIVTFVGCLFVLLAGIVYCFLSFIHLER